jgi:hypothetical protein
VDECILTCLFIFIKELVWKFDFMTSGAKLLLRGSRKCKCSSNQLCFMCQYAHIYPKIVYF